MAAIETLWLVVTLIYGALLLYRRLLGSKEDDQLLLEASDSGLAEEQRRIQARLDRTAPYSKGFGIASLALLIVIGGVWLYRSYQTFVCPPRP
jgi:hypothetical protein